MGRTIDIVVGENRLKAEKALLLHRLLDRGDGLHDSIRFRQAQSGKEVSSAEKDPDQEDKNALPIQPPPERRPFELDAVVGDRRPGYGTDTSHVNSSIAPQVLSFGVGNSFPFLVARG